MYFVCNSLFIVVLLRVAIFMFYSVWNVVHDFEKYCKY